MATTKVSRRPSEDKPALASEAFVDRMGKISTRIEEALGRLRGIEQALELVLQSDPTPEPNELCHLLHDQLRAQLGELAAAHLDLVEAWRSAKVRELRVTAAAKAVA
jgi:hypothetical protein